MMTAGSNCVDVPSQAAPQLPIANQTTMDHSEDLIALNPPDSCSFCLHNSFGSRVLLNAFFMSEI